MEDGTKSLERLCARVEGSFGEPSGVAVLLLGPSGRVRRLVHVEPTQVPEIEALSTVPDEATASVGVNHQGGRQLLAGQELEFP